MGFANKQYTSPAAPFLFANRRVEWDGIVWKAELAFITGWPKLPAFGVFRLFFKGLELA